MKARPLLQGAGFATLYMALFAADFLNSTLGNAYHRFFPLTSIYRAIFLLTLLLWFVGWLSFRVLERMPILWKRIFWVLPTVLLPWLVFRTLSSGTFNSETSQNGIRMLRLGHIVPVCLAVVAAILLVVRPRLYDRFIDGVRVCYMICGFGLLVIIPRIGLQALKTLPPEAPGFQHDHIAAVGNESSPRIVWIVMDELSYDQVFVSRQPGLLLPNFDRLAHESVTFSDLQPPADAPGPGAATEDVLPSLLLGRQIVEMRKPYPGPPSFRSVANGPWQTFNQQDTIFAEAHSVGWTTGVAGWYNPYCRLLRNVLDRCVWVYTEPIHFDQSGALSTRSTVAQNVIAMFPLRDRFDSLLHQSTNEEVRTHINDYRSLMQESKALIEDSSIRFAFIHLPVPHPPGIYDRSRHAISEHGTYLDNLVLADDTLAALEKMIESTPAAANTTLIVSSDHSWRPWVWKPFGMWSAEEERASRGGQFEPRAVLMVHLPGQQEGHSIAKPVNVLIAHTIVESLLHGQIQGPADIDRLLEQPPPQAIAQQTEKPPDVTNGN